MSPKAIIYMTKLTTENLNHNRVNKEASHNQAGACNQGVGLGVYVR